MGSLTPKNPEGNSAAAIAGKTATFTLTRGERPDTFPMGDRGWNIHATLREQPRDAMAMPGPLRIVFGSTERTWRGGESQLALTAEGLRQRGHEVAVVARRDGELARRLEIAGFPIVPIAGRGRNPAAVWRVRSFLRKFRPHVLHFNDGHALTCLGVASLGLKTPVRVASRRVVFPLRGPGRYASLCDRVLCVSRAVAGICAESGLAAEKLRVIYEGVPPRQALEGLERRVRRSLGVSDDCRLLLTVAALTEDKGHRYLLDAAPRVIAHDPNAVFALAGQGHLEAELRRQANALGVAANVRFLGFRNDAPALLQAADAFVMASLSEGLCTSVIDAMLAGKAIVATTAGGVPELIGPQADEPPVAWTAPPQNAPALAEAILACLASPEERRRRGQHAQRRAYARFTAEHMVEATLAGYREILASKSDGLMHSRRRSQAWVRQPACEDSPK